MIRGNGRKRKQKKRETIIRPTMPFKPPQYQVEIQKKQKFRYTLQTTGQVTVDITTQDLFAILTIGNIPTTSAISCFFALRLVKISMWQTGNTSGNMGQVSIRAYNTSGGLGAKPVLIQDIANNNSTIAKITYVPSRSSTLSQWQNVTSTTTISGGGGISVTGNKGDTMDITIEFFLNTNPSTPYLIINSNPGPTIQFVSYGLPVATADWVPVLTLPL